MKHQVRVEIDGQKYTIKGELEEEYIARLADHVNEKIKEIRSNSVNLSKQSVFVLATLMMAQEYFELKEEREGLAQDIEEKTTSLIKYIDSLEV